MRENTIENFLNAQKHFAEAFYQSENMTPKQKEEMLKTIALAMHYEISEIVSSCNFKVFDKTDFSVDKNKILYNNIDVFRYMLATMNLYDIKANQFIDAFHERDLFLKIENRIKKPELNQKVVIVDIDDVIGDFRNYFNSWLKEKYNIHIPEDSTSYYSSKEVKDHGLSPERVFEVFIEENKLLDIPVLTETVELLDNLRKQGVYIQLLTARPDFNLKCKYQTYVWLDKNNIPFDNIDFASEKYIWVAKKDYYIKGNVLFAIDDSPKHSMEYATHDVKVLLPDLPYNQNANHEYITRFDRSNLEFKTLLDNKLV
jgi:uncharacterized HAD superfamily protein